MQCWVRSLTKRRDADSSLSRTQVGTLSFHIIRMTSAATPSLVRRPATAPLWPLFVATGLAIAATAADAQAIDPRIGLKAGWNDAAEAARNLRLIGHHAKPEGFFNPADMGDFAFANSDLAFRGNYVIQGGYHGFQIWDISKPKAPTLRASFSCPGGQGDPSVYGTLLFISVEQSSGRVDCGGQGIADMVSVDRFRGVAHLRHLRSGPPEAGTGGADVPWFAHPYAGDRPE